MILQGLFETARFRGIVGNAWDVLKAKLLVSVSSTCFGVVSVLIVEQLCDPYRKAMVALEEADGVRNLEIRRLLVDNDSKTAEIPRLAADNLTKTAEIARLSADNLTKTTEIARLSADILTKTTDITIKDREISRLTADITMLREKNDYLYGENLSMSKELLVILSKRPHPDGVPGKSSVILPPFISVFANPLPATSTRAKTWQEVMDDNYNRMEELLPSLVNRIRSSEVTKLAATTYEREPAMYKRVQMCFAEHLSIRKGRDHPGSQVIDTHNIQVIQGLKPDLSLVGAARPGATATGIIAAVELKVGALTKDSFGQLYCYLKGIQQAQPTRAIVIGLLSNLVDNQFITLERTPGHRTRCLRYQSVTLAVALTFLRDVVVMSPLYHPPTSLFSPDLGRVVMLMGNPTFSTVGEFLIPTSITMPKFRKHRWVDPNFKVRSGDLCMVVKRTTPGVYAMSFESRAPRSVRNEIEILRRILEHKADDDDLPGAGRLPRILFHGNAFNEFGILPRGHPIHPSNGRTDWGKVVVDVLDALKWLHDIHIIHRDVRLDNIIWNVDHAVLIDLGAAVDMSQNADSPVSFIGGYACCPPGIIGHLESSYVPRPADDCLAVVLLVNTVLFPARWERFRSAELEKPGSPETKILAQFWKNLEVSGVWKQFFVAACGAEYGALKKLVEFFVYL